jgi:hypothetical protein
VGGGTIGTGDRGSDEKAVGLPSRAGRWACSMRVVDAECFCVLFSCVSVFVVEVFGTVLFVDLPL